MVTFQIQSIDAGGVAICLESLLYVSSEHPWRWPIAYVANCTHNYFGTWNGDDFGSHPKRCFHSQDHRPAQCPNCFEVTCFYNRTVTVEKKTPGPSQALVRRDLMHFQHWFSSAWIKRLINQALNSMVCSVCIIGVPERSLLVRRVRKGARTELRSSASISRKVAFVYSNWFISNVWLCSNEDNVKPTQELLWRRPASLHVYPHGCSGSIYRGEELKFIRVRIV